MKIIFYEIQIQVFSICLISDFQLYINLLIKYLVLALSNHRNYQIFEFPTKTMENQLISYQEKEYMINKTGTHLGLADIIQNNLEHHQEQNQDIFNHEEFLRIKLMLNLRQKKIIEKENRIRQLQQKCKIMEADKEKIEKLEAKIQQLEKLLEKLQNHPLQSSLSKSSKHIRQKTVTIQEQQIFKQKNDKGSTDSNLKKQHKTQTSPEKQNKKPDIKENKKNQFKIDEKNILKQEKQEKNLKKSFKRLLETNSGNYQEAISSKFLAPDKLQQGKTKQLDLKFSKMKQNLQNKSKSNKNIEQIYSILSSHSNNHKLGKEQIALKQINDRLKNILDQSTRVKSNSITLNQSQREKERISFRTQHESRISRNDQPKVYTEDIKLKSDSFSLKNNYISVRPEKSFVQSSKREKNFILNNESLFYNPTISNNSLNSSFHSKKMNRILNATTVNEMLETRKCFDVLSTGNGNGFLNKSTDFGVLSTQKSKIYRK